MKYYGYVNSTNKYCYLMLKLNYKRYVHQFNDSYDEILLKKIAIMLLNYCTSHLLSHFNPLYAKIFSSVLVHTKNWIRQRIFILKGGLEKYRKVGLVYK